MLTCCPIHFLKKINKLDHLLTQISSKMMSFGVGNPLPPTTNSRSKVVMCLTLLHQG